jgi:hypothetical protein
MPKPKSKKLAQAMLRSDVEMTLIRNGHDNPQEVLSDLADDLGGEPLFAKGKTPMGTRMMAGVASKMTHFYDVDDGWQKMPFTYERV